MKKYKLLILGYPVKNKKEINHCFSMLTYGLEKEFKKLSHVEVIMGEIQNEQQYYNNTSNAIYDYDNLPNVDFIICVNYGSFFEKKTCDKLKTKCKKLTSFLEVPIKNSDFCFTFRPPTKEGRTLLIPVPYTPEFYENVSKKSKTILLDHMCYRTFVAHSEIEWSRKMWYWLRKIKDKYKISSLILRPKYKWEKIHLDNIPKYIEKIYATTLLDYLEKTKHFENFIVTHQGSFNYSIFDMLIRGTRVLAPHQFIHPEYNVKRFNVPLFSTQRELIDKLESPVNKEYWNKQYERCTPMNEVVTIIDKKFRGWL